MDNITDPKSRPLTRRKKSKIIWRGFFIRLVVLILLAIFSIAGFYAYKFYTFSKKIAQPTVREQIETRSTANELIESARNLVSSDKPPLRGEDRGRINVLLLGMGGEGHSGKYLTDTIMLASFDPKTFQSALLSIPRDLYVEIPDWKVYTKINAVYAYGMMSSQRDSVQSMDALKNVVGKITGQEIDYYVLMDFDGFQSVINELGGIDVEVKDDILDTRYPGPNFSYQTFEIKKGFHHLEGETALKFARVRHTKGGDFSRAERQQQILAATKKKALSLGTILNPHRLTSFVDALGESLKTDIELSEFPAFIEIAKNVNIYQTTNKVLDAWSPDSLLGSTHKVLGGTPAYVLLPRAGNYSQVHELTRNIFDLAHIERKKKSIEEEDASIGILVQSKNDNYKIRNIFSKLGYGSAISLYQREDLACQNQNLIFNNSEKPKVFTLDDLATKFEADVKDEKISDLSEDVVVCLNEDAADYFKLQNEKAEEEDENLKDQSILDEKGDVRINRSK